MGKLEAPPISPQHHLFICRLDPMAVSEGLPYSALEIAASEGKTSGAFAKLAAHAEGSHKKTVCQLLACTWKENQPSDKFKELLSNIPTTEVGQDIDKLLNV